jgi:hypothetical protein
MNKPRTKFWVSMVLVAIVIVSCAGFLITKAGAMEKSGAAVSWKKPPQPPQRVPFQKDTLIQYNNKGVIEGAPDLIYKNGFLGVGEPNPANLLDVSGSVAIGVDYTALPAPEQGLRVQGHVLIGFPRENAARDNLQVTGSASFTKHIVVGTAKNPAGITIYDKINNKPYCLGISNGIIENSAGECKDN